MIRTRIGVALATAVLGGAGVLGLAACSPSDTALSTEGQVLAAMGYSTEDLQAEEQSLTGDNPARPSAGPSAKGGERRRHLAGKILMHKNVLHGEATVQTKEGVKI